MKSQATVRRSPSAVKVSSGRSAVEPVHLDVAAFEVERTPGEIARVHQVLHDLVLAVDGDAPSAGQRRQVDAMALLLEREPDPRVRHPFARQPVAHAGVPHQIRRPLFEHPGPDAFDDVIAGPVLDDHRIDAVAVQQMAQHQAGGPGADDADLRAFHADHYTFGVRDSGFGVRDQGLGIRDQGSGIRDRPGASARLTSSAAYSITLTPAISRNSSTAVATL